jgi:putative inorganic carbon (hco3(-)) transporter
MRPSVSGSSRALLLAAACVLLAPLGSGLTSGWVSVPLKALVVAVLAITLWRPRDGLLVVAGLTPLAGLLLPIGRVPPIRLAEALVLAFLCGWLARLAATSRREDRPPLPPALALFAIVLLASCVVELATLQIATDYPGAFAQRAWWFVRRAFLRPSGDFPSLTAAALLLEGLGLLAAVPILAAGDRELPRRLLGVTVVAGVTVAALNLATFASGLTAGGRSGALRISAHVRDVNAAGSYLAMILPLAPALLVSQRRRGLALVPATLTGAATWLTGSRAAVAAAGGVVMAAVAWQTLRHRLAASRRLAVATAAGAVVLIAAIAVAPGAVVREVSASRALDVRMEFLATSLRMMAATPLFGIGIGQYYHSSSAFMSPGLRAIYPIENAHNNFLQIGAELGLVGLALFLWMLWDALARLFRRVRDRIDDPVPAALFAGLGAFLLTCLTGHPLLVPEVAFPFWLTLGAAAAAGARDRASCPPAARARYRLATALGLLVVLVSVPIRVAGKTGVTDISTVTYGLSEPESSRAGVVFRRVNGEAAFFVRSSVRAMELPLAIADSAPGEATEVEIALDGHPANRVRVESSGWTRMRMVLPQASTGRAFRRLDLQVVCPKDGGAGETCPGLNDERLAVGEMTTIE